MIITATAAARFNTAIAAIAKAQDAQAQGWIGSADMARDIAAAKARFNDCELEALQTYSKLIRKGASITRDGDKITVA